MPIFQQDASAFNTAPFLPQSGEDYQIKVTGFKLDTWDYEGTTNLKLRISQRIESENPDENGKMLNYEVNFATINKETREVLTVDMTKISEVIHACLGFDNMSKEADAAFAERFAPSDFTFDTGTQDNPELTLVGTGWDEVKDCSYKCTIKVQPNKKGDRMNVYFNSVRPITD